MNGALRRGGLWACLFAAVLTPAGCTTYGGYGGGYGSYGSYGSSSRSNANLTSDEKLLREQSDSFVQENVFGGAATGAIVGCLLGGQSLLALLQRAQIPIELDLVVLGQLLLAIGLKLEIAVIAGRELLLRLLIGGAGPQEERDPDQAYP